jgi:hypothetical protein
MNSYGIRRFTAPFLFATAAFLCTTAASIIQEASAAPIGFPSCCFAGPFPSDSLPPSGSVYPAVASVHRFGPVDEFQLRGSSHSGFSSSSPPPPSIPNASTLHPFDSFIEGDFFVNGVFIQHVIAPAATLVRVDFNDQIGLDRFFDAEILQLDIAGGNLPPGILIRESPLISSNGQTVIRDIGGGEFQIASFFDIFTELSLDGGQTWIPSNGAVTMVLQAAPEPGTILLLSFAVAAMSAARLHRRKAIPAGPKA